MAAGSGVGEASAGIRLGLGRRRGIPPAGQDSSAAPAAESAVSDGGGGSSAVGSTMIGGSTGAGPWLSTANTCSSVSVFHTADEDRGPSAGASHESTVLSTVPHTMLSPSLACPRRCCRRRRVPHTMLSRRRRAPDDVVVAVGAPDDVVAGSVPQTMLSPSSPCPRRCCRRRRAPDDVVAPPLGAPHDVVAVVPCPRRCCRRRRRCPTRCCRRAAVPHTMLSSSPPCPRRCCRRTAVPHTMLSSASPHDVVVVRRGAPDDVVAAAIARAPHDVVAVAGSQHPSSCRSRTRSPSAPGRRR